MDSSIRCRGREIAHVSITIFDGQPPPPPPPTVIMGVLVLGAPRTIAEPRSIKMAAQTQMKVGQELEAGITAQPAGAKFDGAPTWGASTDGVVSITPSEDGLEAKVRALAAGETVITVTVDVRHGDEVVQRTAEGTITVTELEAESIELTFGEPVTPAV